MNKPYTDKEFEEFKNWIEGGGSNGKLLDYHTGVTRLIAYCEELREREIGWAMTLSSLEEENEKLKEDVRWAEESEMGVIKERDFLKEENANLERYNLEHRRQGKVYFKSIEELEEENAKLKLEIDEWSSTSTVDTKRNQEILAVAKIHAEENKKLKAILLAYLEIPIKELKESKIAHRVVGKEYW